MEVLEYYQRGTLWVFRGSEERRPPLLVIPVIFNILIIGVLKRVLTIGSFRVNNFCELSFVARYSVMIETVELLVFLIFGILPASAFNSYPIYESRHFTKKSIKIDVNYGKNTRFRYLFVGASVFESKTNKPF